MEHYVHDTIGRALRRCQEKPPKRRSATWRSGANRHYGQELLQVSPLGLLPEESRSLIRAAVRPNVNDEPSACRVDYVDPARIHIDSRADMLPQLGHRGGLGFRRSPRGNAAAECGHNDQPAVAT